MNALIGFYSGYNSLETTSGGLRPFVESFRRYNSSDVVIVATCLPINCHDFEGFCSDHNCIVEIVDPLNPQSDNRWSKYHDILSKPEYKSVEYVLVMDMNDAIFTGNPFDISQSKRIYCAAEHSKYCDTSHNSTRINIDWINNVRQDGRSIVHVQRFGGDDMNCNEVALYRKNILCSGSILGPFTEMMSMFEWAYNLTGADQGMLNIFAYIAHPERCEVISLQQSRILTMDCVNFSDLKKDERGHILNELGERYLICHQIDRGGHLSDFLELAEARTVLRLKSSLSDPYDAQNYVVFKHADDDISRYVVKANEMMWHFKISQIKKIGIRSFAEWKMSVGEHCKAVIVFNPLSLVLFRGSASELQCEPGSLFVFPSYILYRCQKGLVYHAEGDSFQ